MACAKKCDRCGKLYEEYNSKNNEKNPNGIMVLNLDYKRQYYSHTVMDLCQDCMKGFHDWMKEVKQMERLTLDDMIKALKCVASQDTEGDCYKDHENFNHMEDDKYKRIVCGTGENLKDWISGRDAVGCPYHQNTYGCCFEDGDLYWMKDVAELLEELKELRSYKEKMELQYLDDIGDPLEPLKLSSALESEIIK